MARLNLADAAIATPSDNLDELIPNYAVNKAELDSYKKLCDADNAKIKDLMKLAGEDEHVAGEFVAKRTIVEKESIDESMLLLVLKKHHIEGVIKTKEYVDMDALESYLYNHETDNAFAADLAGCKEVKQEVRLTVKSIKRRKSED